MSVQPFVAAPVTDVEVARAVARRAAARLGVGEPVLLRVGSNALFAVGDDVVLRVGHFTAAPAAAAALATLLTGAGVRVPSVRAALDDLDEHLGVIVVDRVRTVDRPVDWAAVGDAIGRVHVLASDSVATVHPLPSCTVFGHWRFVALFDEVAPDLGGPERSALATVVERVSGWGETVAVAPQVVCHGDVHPGNVLMSADGPVVIDWDMVCAAPAAWDHAALLTWEERWGGTPGLYASFAAGYGLDLRDDPLATVLAEGRLLAATLMRCRAGRTDPAAADEARRRLRYWLGDPAAPVWRAA